MIQKAMIIFAFLGTTIQVAHFPMMSWSQPASRLRTFSLSGGFR